MTAELFRIIATASPERAALLTLLLCLVLAAAAIRWLAAELGSARAELREDYTLQRALLARLGGCHAGDKTSVPELEIEPRRAETRPAVDPNAAGRPAGLASVTLAPHRKPYTAPRVTMTNKLKLYTAPALWPLDEPEAIHQLEARALARTAG